MSQGQIVCAKVYQVSILLITCQRVEQMLSLAPRRWTNKKYSFYLSRVTRERFRMKGKAAMMTTFMQKVTAEAAMKTGTMTVYMTGMASTRRGGCSVVVVVALSHVSVVVAMRVRPRQGCDRKWARIRVRLLFLLVKIHAVRAGGRGANDGKVKHTRRPGTP
jgi:S-adenosylmethionine/arginine decarboxylase-like enzyme